MPLTLAQAFPAPTAAHVEEAVNRLVKAFDPLRIIVFGSYARGDTYPGSDLDLLVELPAVDDQRETQIAMRGILSGLGVPKDVIVTTSGEIERRGWIIGTVLREALENGREVYKKQAET